MHQDFLLQALRLAKLGKGQCAPNPAVGALVVQDNVVVGQGYHHSAGTPHAEIHALKEAGEKSQGASLYVTLEPCCHHGRTPPCTEAIKAAGIRHVYFGALDSNPKVAGQGRAWLQQQGIFCEHISLPLIDDFYRSYHHWTKTHTPWITGKLALTLDGKIAGPEGKPVAITTRPAIAIFTHQCRRAADALLTSVRCIQHDDPHLNVRLDDQILPKKLYIVDRLLRLPATAKIFKTSSSITVFHEDTGNYAAVERLKNLGVRCMSLACENEKLDLKEAQFLIGQDGIHDLWVEAGGMIFSSLLDQGLLNEPYVYLAFKTLGPEATAAFSEPLEFMNYFKTVSITFLDQEAICRFTDTV